LRSEGVIGEVINLGTGFEISIGDAAHAIADVMDTPIDVELDTQRLRPQKSEVERLCADNGKARRLMGWSPRYTGLDGFKRGLGRTVDWFKDPAHLGLYKVEAYNL
jgi:dTDP-glucose 4,6-dehydratase